ncbi:MAG: helix-turn-helix domain-containing protein [Bacillota bacterium]
MEEINIGAKIRKIRFEKGLSTLNLAEMAGLSQQYISLIENGKTTPSLKSLFKISAALNVNPGIILEDLDNQEQKPHLYNLTDIDLRDFILHEENIEYIRLAKEMKEKNISTGDMKTFMEIVHKNMLK